MTLKIPPLRPYMPFTDGSGNLTKDAYDFLFALFQRVGGSLSALNAASLQDHTWEEPGALGTVTPNSGEFSTLKTHNAVTLQPFNSNVLIQPLGTGNVTITTPPGVTGAINGMTLGLGTAADARVNNLKVEFGVSSSGGMQHKRQNFSVPASSSASITVTWPVAFNNDSYTLTCSVLQGGHALTVTCIESVTATDATIVITNTTGSLANGILHVIAMHD